MLKDIGTGFDRLAHPVTQRIFAFLLFLAGFSLTATGIVSFMIQHRGGVIGRIMFSTDLSHNFLTNIISTTPVTWLFSALFIILGLTLTITGITNLFVPKTIKYATITKPLNPKKRQPQIIIGILLLITSILIITNASYSMILSQEGGTLGIGVYTTEVLPNIITDALRNEIMTWITASITMIIGLTLLTTSTNTLIRRKP